MLGRRLTRRWRADRGDCRTAVAVTGRAGGTAGPHLITIGLGAGRVRIRCDDSIIVAKQNEVFHRVWAILNVLAEMSSLHGAEVIADISDGEDSGPGVISFCSRDSRAILIPDHVFVRTRGYEAERALVRTSLTDWDERSDRIVWRGSSTGIGLISKTDLSETDPELISRVRLCLALKDVRGTDVKLSSIAQSTNKVRDTERLSRAGILGEFISPICWYGFKFAIDIDGNSNAWSNFLTRLMMGCCVLKVASAAGYRQWYYGDIQAWTHYVPVKADLSDLHEVIGWCRGNPAECRKIAAQGQAFAMALKFEAEMASARERISRAYIDGKLDGPGAPRAEGDMSSGRQQGG
jgi:hypothetical protein